MKIKLLEHMQRIIKDHQTIKNMKYLLVILVFISSMFVMNSSAEFTTNQTGQDRTKPTLIQELLNIAEEFNSNEQNNFDRTMELVLGHLTGAPVILATDGSVLTQKEALALPGALIDPELGGPTGNVEEVEQIFQGWCNDIDGATQVLRRFNGAAHQAEALDILEKVRDMSQNFHDLILAEIQRNNTRPALGLVEGQEREIENSATIPFKFGRSGIVESSYVSEIPLKGGAVVTKEFAGIRAFLVCRRIPIWAEPWASRRRIIGYKRVYQIRFYPCEYIKSIIYEAEKDPRVHTMWHCDRGLMSFWNYPLTRA